MIRVHGVFDPFYHAYYLRGLAQRFGEGALRFGCAGFPRFERTGLAFVTQRPARRVYVDADDHDGLDDAALSWCDVYGKVNLNPAAVPPAAADRVVPMGPGFGIRDARLLRAAPIALFAALRHGGGEKRLGTLLRRWRWMIADRLPLAAYEAEARSHDDYVFFASSVWAPEDPCNAVRARFVAAARAIPGVRFEGGFVPPHRDDVPECVPYRIDRTYRLADYLARLRRSLVAFNTPAVLDCHGWKLGEYLALGKAILSTPLTRALPAPLEPGRHAHFVEGSGESIADGIARLRRDRAGRRRLEQAARRYFVEHLAPERAIERLLRAEGCRAGG